MKKLIAILLSVMMVAALLVGCSAAKNESAAADNYYAYSSTTGAAYESGSGSVANRYPGSGTDTEVAEDSFSTGSSPDHVTVTPISQKLVRTIRISTETEDLDALLQEIDAKIVALEGYAENREVYNGSSSAVRRYRHATLTIRIPAEKLNSFIGEVTGISNVTSSSETVEDITLNYVDVNSRVLALETEQTRLLELLAKAETMDDLLQIEDRLTDVRAELERYNSQLRLMDSLVNYSTVHLEISEVKEYTVVTEPETVWDRISTGFMNNLKNLGNFFVNLFVFLVAALPYLVIIAGVTIVIILLCRKRKNKKRKETPPAEKE